MAESADILGAPHQQVILPDLAAGCSMADMAAIDQLEICWDELATLGVTERRPGHLHQLHRRHQSASVGEHGGIVCTSSNAAKVMAWAWERGEKLLMLPDQHLGRNTAFKMGVPLDEMVVWDPDHAVRRPRRATQLRRARLILWKGHCSVHTRFTVKQIEQFRRTHPQGKVIVHPECTFDVVQAADDSGSTEHIIRTVKASPEDSSGPSAPRSIWSIAWRARSRPTGPS